jgi:methyl-accepting chemotaxis protein
VRQGLAGTRDAAVKEQRHGTQTVAAVAELKAAVAELTAAVAELTAAVAELTAAAACGEGGSSMWRRRQ